jgi:RHS repeat-associated protein
LRASTLSERRADYDALPLAWASQEVDPDTGLSHYHFREYSPPLGGWLTQDPIGLAGGYLNLRSYLGNRPTDALDQWGREAFAKDTEDKKTTMKNSKELLVFLGKAKDKSIKKLDLDGHGNQFQQTLDSESNNYGSLKLNDATETKKGEKILLEGDDLEEEAKKLSLAAARDTDGRVYGVYIDGLLAQKMAEDSRINLLGCMAGGFAPEYCQHCQEYSKGRRSPNSFANELSKTIPQSIVAGSSLPTTGLIGQDGKMIPGIIRWKHVNLYSKGVLKEHTLVEKTKAIYDANE